MAICWTGEQYLMKAKGTVVTQAKNQYMILKATVQLFIGQQSPLIC